MEPDTLELLKWFVYLPAAVVAVVTLPWVILKYHLECRKIRLEIAQLDKGSSEQQIRKHATPGRAFAWFAHYWPIPCYGSTGLLLVLAVWKRSAILGVATFAVSLGLFVAGSTVGERYKELMSQKRDES